MTTNTELIARLKEQCDRDAAEHCPAEIIALQAEGIAAIEALEAQLKNASVAAIAEAAEVDRLQAEVERLTLERDVNKRMRDQHFAEVERLTTLARGQHIELYNARLQLAAAQGQEPVGYMHPELPKAISSQDFVNQPEHIQIVWMRGAKLYAAPIPQQQSVPEGWKLVPIEPTHLQAKAAADAWLGCDSLLYLNKAMAAAKAMLASAPQPKEPK